jgi:tRNA-splicing ligase RtcB
MAKDSFHGPLEQVDPCCWRIPKRYKQGMRVDGLIFANDKLVRQLVQDQAPEQVANVAFLPGIQVASLAMPDIHWGYGFCIGGVAATDPDQGGVISPGGVGYDINCIPCMSQICHELGYTRAIGEMASEWHRAELACFDLGAARQTATRVCHWFGQKPTKPVLRVTTAGGDTLEATADHPFWTPEGMVPVGELQTGDRVALAPFMGVPYEAPSDEVLLTEADILRRLHELNPLPGGGRAQQILRFLRDRDLLPLCYSSPALPYLCKILGFVFGDGNIHFGKGTGKGVVGFWGDPEDLDSIRADIARLGVTPSKIYSRQREHAFQTEYADVCFTNTEYSCKVVGSAFALLLACLGAPVGNKTRQDYDAPAWLDRAPRWYRRLFLASLFGAELSTPSSVPGHGTVLAQPTLGMNKKPEFIASARRFLEQVSTWLREFEIETQSILLDKPTSRGTGQGSQRFRLVLSTKLESLIHLYGRVGFEYNHKRSARAALALQYLKHKRIHLEARAEARQQAHALASVGGERGQLFLWPVEDEDNLPFQPVHHRVGKDFPTFDQFCVNHSAGTSPGGMVWDTVVAIDPVEEFDGLVYDFTVTHPDHNFVANGFVVSNCGVRLVRSNLFYRDVKPHLRTLIDELFKTVPTGVGRSGKYRFDRRELQHLMGQGSRDLISRGLATANDIALTEAEGLLEGADPSLVSDHALNRGSDQCGTLGSGNHFMEVQIVDHIFDPVAAQVMGLEKDMICVMIHSGSRGLGYQVCDDALHAFRKTPEKYGIDLPDRQLACAPAQSPEGQRYIGAMRAAANYAWCNRQLLMMQARDAFAKVFGRSWQEMQMNLIYDVCHNIAKLEEHTIDGKRKKVWVHRKGATRAFPPGHPEVPDIYRGIGQPVIIPGDMGRASWVLVGQPGSMEKTFGTTCHGAGRVLSRTAAVRQSGGRRIDKELEAMGIIARAQSRKGLAEEQPAAYKNVDDVVDVVDEAGLSKKVARMRPLGVIKG